MVPSELLEELRQTWGPPPVLPDQRAIWEEGMKILSEIPQLIAQAVERDGTRFNSLTRNLGSLGALAVLEADCIERFICRRITEPLPKAIDEVVRSPRWALRLEHLSPLQRTRLKARLGEDVADTLAIVVLGNLRLRRWFFPGDDLIREDLDGPLS